MQRYPARPNASTQKRLDELKRLEKRKSRAKERIALLTTTKRGTPRVRVDEAALKKARARKREIDAEIRAAREKEKKRSATQKKRKAPHRREAPAKTRPLRKTQLSSEKERASFEKEVRRQAKEEAREEERQRRARNRRRNRSRKRQEAVELGDYQTLAEMDDISDSEAFTIILYESQGEIAA